MPYSFTEPVVPHLMLMAHSLVPGIQKVVGIYWDGSEQRLTASTILSPRGGSMSEHLDIPASSLPQIRLLREEYRNFAWFHDQDLPFETPVTREKQLDVFLEMERNILMVPVSNEADHQSDLLFFYFSENFSTFKMSSSSKNLMPEHRIIIGTMLQNSLKTIVQLEQANREVLYQVNGSTRSIIERYKETQEELKRLTSGAQRNILDICRHLLDEITPGGSSRYILTPAAAEKLKKFKGEIPELKAILKKAVTFASALEFDQFREEIKLDEFHIDLDLTRDKPRPANITVMPSARYAKTVALLDKLEEAAGKVLTKDLPLTGANVGSACSKAISAPAVSDALKKHRNKIITLLNEYPDRWNLLRSEFKPLINILTSRRSEGNEDVKNAG